MLVLITSSTKYGIPSRYIKALSIFIVAIIRKNNQYALILRYFFTKAFASSITGTLAAQALLKGVGVGDESATVMAATLTWILKGSLSLSF